MEANENKYEFKKELKKYLEHLEDTRNEMWVEFVKPVRKIVNTKELSNDEKVQSLIEIEYTFMKQVKQWKFVSQAFGG